MPPNGSSADSGAPIKQMYGSIHAPGNPLQSTITIGLPLGLYILIAYIFAFQLDSPLVPVFVCLAVFAIGMAVPTWFHRAGDTSNFFRPAHDMHEETHLERQAVSRWVPAVCVALALVTGACTGTRAHFAFVRQYFTAVHGQNYRTPVHASSMGAAYADAGKIIFSRSSELNEEWAVGFMERDVFCVAPVLESGAEQTKTVSFWAVGLNCCKERGSFECGGGVSTQGGLRVVRDGPFFDYDYQNYMKAVELSATLHSLSVDEDAILVLWTWEPDALANTFLRDAIMILVVGGVLYTAQILFVVFTASLLKARRQVKRGN